MDLASRLENPNSDRTVLLDDCRDAARELRYMATSFTLKANFVPSNLTIANLQRELICVRNACTMLQLAVESTRITPERAGDLRELAGFLEHAAAIAEYHRGDTHFSAQGITSLRSAAVALFSLAGGRS